MGNVRLSVNPRNWMLNVFRDTLAAYAQTPFGQIVENGAYLDIYSGTQPASADDPPGEDCVLLCSMRLVDGIAEDAADGVLSFTVSDERARRHQPFGTVIEDGTASWCRVRVVDQAAPQDYMLDCDAGLAAEDPANNPTAVLSEVELVRDEEVDLLSFSITFPESC